MNIRFDNDPDVHECIGSIDGDTVTFTCPKCVGWKMTMSLTTGQYQKNTIAKQSNIRHSGTSTNINNILSWTN